KVTQAINAGNNRCNRSKLTPEGEFARSADLEAGDLVVVDASARKEIRRMPLGRQPEGILIPPRGAHAFVAVNGDDNVAMIDLKTWQVTKRISAGAGPDGLAWGR